MAPSLESSVHGTLPFPPQTSPVRAVAKLLADTMAARASSSSQPTNTIIPTSEPPRTPSRSQAVVEALTGTSAAYLLSPTPLSAHTAPPKYHATPISPMKSRYTHLLNREPSSAIEAIYQEALQESEARNQAQKQSRINLQATVILQGGYLNEVHQRMYNREQKEAGKKATGKLIGDGLPRVLTDDKFVEEVAKHDQAQKRKAEEKEERKAEKERHAKAMERWKEACRARDERVKVQKEQYHRALEEWEDERQQAKAERQRIGWQKPTLGPVEKKPERPKRVQAQPADDEGSERGTGGRERDGDGL